MLNTLQISASTIWWILQTSLVAILIQPAEPCSELRYNSPCLDVLGHSLKAGEQTAAFLWLQPPISSVIFILQDSWTAAFISNAVTRLMTPGIVSASSAALFANWSAISLPAMSACPVVHFKLIWICSFSNDCNVWLTSASTCFCELFCHQRVKIPTADSDSENKVTSINRLFLTATLTWSSAIL